MCLIACHDITLGKVPVAPCCFCYNKKLDIKGPMFCINACLTISCQELLLQEIAQLILRVAAFFKSKF
jgi:hypothetical protein